MCVLSLWACMCLIIRMCIQVDSLSKALSFSQHENLKLKTEIAKVHICPTTNSVYTVCRYGIYIAQLRLQYNVYVFSVMLQAQLSGLAPLVVPKRLLHRGRGEKGDGEGESGEFNQTDLEKTLAKDAANILRVGGGE